MTHLAFAALLAVALTALVAQHLWWTREAATAVNTATALKDTAHDEEIGRWREDYQDVYDQLLRSERNHLAAVAHNLRLIDDLHWARLALAVQIAGDDFRGDVLGAGADVISLDERRAR